MSSYLCGLDIGGTFTDCVLIDDSGRLTISKAPSTPGNFADGVLEALKRAGDRIGLGLPALLSSITMLAHGTTAGTNAIIQRKGAKVGLVTTKGHNDVIHIMRGSRGLSGQDIKLIVHIPESSKPDPIIPKRLIRGVSERVDCFGKVVVELNEDEVRQAIRELLDQGVEALAVCFLWSFLEPKHERRVKEIAAEIAPQLYVTCSCDLAPKWGEYERTTAVALNAYIGPLTVNYVTNLDQRLKDMGYAPPLQITQCAGGTISVRKAREAPLLTLDSGPVSGVTGSLYLGQVMGEKHIITTDMGGTSFDVGVIHEAKAVVSYKSLVHQYEYFLPKVDVQTMGTGGGSKVWIDKTTKTLRVGPQSAGAVPGPVCYGRGGEVPTTTDADVVLGYLDAENFAGGTIKLDKAGATAGLQKLADELGMSLYELASGVAQIAEFQMADLVRKATIQKGLDPREFVLFAFGGAGPVHMAVTAREAGIKRVIVPQGDTASTWCAFGAASADTLHVNEQVRIMPSPFDVAKINDVLAELAAKGRAQLEEDGIAAAQQHFHHSIDMRHRGQINEVEVDIDKPALAASDLDDLRARFVRRYEQLYGRGASLPGARLECVTFRVRASAAARKPKLVAADALTKNIPAAARTGERDIYWAEWKKLAATPIYDGYALLPGNAIDGPCVIETTTTSIVVHPGQRVEVDALRNFVIDTDAKSAT
ncbi:MAG: hydantoinase/oxoprolinase family protein [Gammaproteobacteria bacterium]|nr:hydantoinase/oxoprolinase family protein [Gammaproteobacteria bacterium]MBI5615620.1 hydantoinase/oxoprolinase family protein [Gammaproteobacteria bacterium]